MSLRTAGLNLYDYRELFGALLWRELKARYKGSVLGYAWSLLNPLLLLVVYNLVFSQVLRVGVPDYASFLLCGLLTWNWVQIALTHCSSSMIANAGLIKRVYFPLEMLPSVMVTSSMVNYVVSLPVLLGFLWFEGHAPGVALLAVPLLIAITWMLLLGVGLMLAALTVYFRDVEHLLALGLMVWFYLTPYLYPMSMVPASFRAFVWLNPLAPLAEGMRSTCLDNAWPDWARLAYAALFALATLGVGASAFLRYKYDFHEVV